LLKDLDALTTDIAVGETSFRKSPLHSLLGVNNAFISAKKNSLFWKKTFYPLVLKALHSYTLLDMLSPLYHVLKTAGPGAWTTAASNSSQIHVLPQEYFYSLKKVKKTSVTKSDVDLLNLSYAYHAQDSSWLKSWESIIIQLFIGNNWKFTFFVLVCIVLVFKI